VSRAFNAESTSSSQTYAASSSLNQTRWAEPVVRKVWGFVAVREVVIVVVADGVMVALLLWWR
jgi:hypothetical protein